MAPFGRVVGKQYQKNNTAGQVNRKYEEGGTVLIKYSFVTTSLHLRYSAP